MLKVSGTGPSPAAPGIIVNSRTTDNIFCNDGFKYKKERVDHMGSDNSSREDLARTTREEGVVHNHGFAPRLGLTKNTPGNLGHPR